MNIHNIMLAMNCIQNLNPRKDSNNSKQDRIIELYKKLITTATNNLNVEANVVKPDLNSKTLS